MKVLLFPSFIQIQKQCRIKSGVSQHLNNSSSFPKYMILPHKLAHWHYQVSVIQQPHMATMTLICQRTNAWLTSVSDFFIRKTSSLQARDWIPTWWARQPSRSGLQGMESGKQNILDILFTLSTFQHRCPWTCELGTSWKPYPDTCKNVSSW